MMQLAFSVKSCLLSQKQRTGWDKCTNVKEGSRGHVQGLVIELIITFVVFGDRKKQSLPLLHFMPWISILTNKVFYNLIITCFRSLFIYTVLYNRLGKYILSPYSSLLSTCSRLIFRTREKLPIIQGQLINSLKLWH